MGYPMEQVSYEDWQVQLSNARKILISSLPFFRHKWSDEQLTYIELNEREKTPLAVKKHLPHLQVLLSSVLP